MDGFVLTLWIIRILFLLLIYAFLFAVVRRVSPTGGFSGRG